MENAIARSHSMEWIPSGSSWTYWHWEWVTLVCNTAFPFGTVRNAKVSYPFFRNKTQQKNKTENERFCTVWFFFGSWKLDSLVLGVVLCFTSKYFPRILKYGPCEALTSNEWSEVSKLKKAPWTRSKVSVISLWFPHLSL